MNHKKIIITSCIILIILLSGCKNSRPSIIIQPTNTDYMERYYHSYTTPLNIELTTSGIYYNITNMTVSKSNGITASSTGIIINKNAIYKISGGLSFTGGNGGIYEFEIHKNDIPQENCAFFRSTSTTAIGHAGINCLLNLTIGDKLKMKIKDMSNPPKDINIYQANMNIIEIK